MKDNFSSESDKYARFRPTYPPEFFDYLNSILPAKQNAWDCGTGNGQVAHELAKTFENVFATDISPSQLANAIQTENITYSIQAAEKTDFPDRLFDLIMTAQAIHWFDFDKFYSEVRRTAKENALICVIGYGRIEISTEADYIITQFYKNVVGPFWDKERKYLDENYSTIPFPFKEIQSPAFVIRHHWTLEHLVGYLNTWSGVKHFFNQNGYNPVDQLQTEIEQNWGNEKTREIRFPLLLRMGRISSF